MLDQILFLFTKCEKDKKFASYQDQHITITFIHKVCEAEKGRRGEARTNREVERSVSRRIFLEKDKHS